MMDAAFLNRCEREAAPVVGWPEWGGITCTMKLEPLGESQIVWITGESGRCSERRVSQHESACLWEHHLDAAMQDAAIELVAVRDETSQRIVGYLPESCVPDEFPDDMESMSRREALLAAVKVLKKGD